jgi:hypothetical protein
MVFSLIDVIIPAVKHTNFLLYLVIPVPHQVRDKCGGIQYYQKLLWIPALRCAAAGATYLIAGLIISKTSLKSYLPFNFRARFNF